MKTFLLVLVLATPGWSFRSEFAFSASSPANHFVPENLLRLARAAEEADLNRFARDLGCWSNGDERVGSITCEENGEEIVFRFDRHDDYKPEAILIMVPAP